MTEKAKGPADRDAQVNVSAPPPEVDEPDSLGEGVEPAPDPEDRKTPPPVKDKDLAAPAAPAPYTEVRSPEGEVKTVDVGASKGVDKTPRSRR